jgi:hypothetical protein
MELAWFTFTRGRGCVFDAVSGNNAVYDGSFTLLSFTGVEASFFKYLFHVLRAFLCHSTCQLQMTVAHIDGAIN